MAKYVSLERLGLFLNNLKDIFATKSEIANKSDSTHSHDDKYYTENEIDTKVNELSTAIEGKAATSHTHTMSEMTDLQTKIDEIDNALSDKSVIQFVTWEVGD